ncbi:hypothetical protein AVV29_gp107 [Vibrio phage phi 3]|uniref:Uncharacterized protein n=1 Tax=Vibrio phage phi 3 TaxID=1589298 RepID=A0A0B5GYT7_9CAUD|nr:hypothetical protein AVV29_gp107 [Vibrio phage phi 3]AJF40871.1 hypothetical protein SBVP3_00104 [Vibrio phage phi 3]
MLRKPKDSLVWKASEACDYIAEGYQVDLVIPSETVIAAVRAQIAIFLCTRYGYSASNSQALVEEKVQFIRNCKTPRNNVKIV